MKLRFQPEALRRLLRWTESALFAVAIALFAYYGSVTADAWMFQRTQRRQLEQLLAERRVAPPELLPAAAAANSRKAARPAAAGPLMGRLEIPRIGVSVMVMEGTSGRTLRHAVGHIDGTALPGQPGNVGLSGHRDTFFRPLRNIRVNDLISVTTPLGEFHYRVVSTSVVEPADVNVLAAGRTEVLTLVTCYPFYFVGPAPSRFIVRAERVDDSL
jgi:sortase A